MSEFMNRINTQRQIIKMINSTISKAEPLLSISKSAITRWSNNHNISLDSDLAKLLLQASDKLFFLANKSQEQVTNEYMYLSQEVALIINQIKAELIVKNQIAFS